MRMCVYAFQRTSEKHAPNASIPLGGAAAAVAVRSYGVLAFDCKKQ